MEGPTVATPGDDAATSVSENTKRSCCTGGPELRAVREGETLDETENGPGLNHLEPECSEQRVRPGKSCTFQAHLNPTWVTSNGNSDGTSGGPVLTPAEHPGHYGDGTRAGCLISTHL